MKRYRLICMSFDGDYITEGPIFDTPENAWEHSSDMGSKWYFYPFHFVTTESRKTIRDTPEDISFINNMRVTTIQRLFKNHSLEPEVTDMDATEFILSL